MVPVGRAKEDEYRTNKPKTNFALANEVKRPARTNARMVFVQPPSATHLPSRFARSCSRDSLRLLTVCWRTPFAFPRFSARRLEPRLARERSVAHPSRDYGSVPLASARGPPPARAIVAGRDGQGPSESSSTETGCVGPETPVARKRNQSHTVRWRPIQSRPPLSL